MQIDARHWTVAGATALGLHAAVAVMLFQTPPHPAINLGGGGVQVMLAPVAGPSAAQAPTGPQQDASEVTPSQTVAAAAPPVETPTRPNAEPVQAPKAETVPEAPPDAPVEPAKVETVEKVKPETVEPVRPEAVPPPLPEVAKVPAPEPVPVRPPEAQTVEARDAVTPPTPRARPEPPRRVAARTAPQPRPDETRTAEAPPAAGPVSAASEVQGQTGRQSAGGQPAPRADRGAPTSMAAAGGVADYMSQLRAWLEQHKEYPNRARRRRIEGTALLVFVMDRGGNVLSHRIERSAGDPSLDHAVQEMIERAQPLPRIPEDFQQAQLEVRVPVQFLLR